MSYYVNDIVTFSEKGFDFLDLSYFDSDDEIVIDSVNSEYLQGKGLRYIPRSLRLEYNVVARILDQHAHHLVKDQIGIYNTNDICSLEPCIDFEMEVDEYGPNKVNPMKAPFTLNGAVSGWIAMREQLNNVSLSVNAGLCGLFSAFSICELDLYDDKISNGIIFGANLRENIYRKYNLSSSFNKELAVGILVSLHQNESSIIEVLDCQSIVYDFTLLQQMLQDNADYTFIEGDQFSELKNITCSSFIHNTSFQLSYFPFIINNIRSIVNIKTNAICNYVVVDKNGLMASVRFRVL